MCEAITASVDSFVTGYPELVVNGGRVAPHGARIHFHWTLTSTYSAPVGTSRAVRTPGSTAGCSMAKALLPSRQDATDRERQIQSSMTMARPPERPPTEAVCFRSFAIHGWRFGARHALQSAESFDASADSCEIA